MDIINIIIGAGIIIGGLLIAYMEFFKKDKKWANCLIIDMINNPTPYSIPLKSFKKRSSNNKNKTSISWLYIPKLKKYALIPKNKYIYRSNKGSRFIIYAWYGGNNLVPITVNEMQFKFKKKQKNALTKGIDYICDRVESPELSVITEELLYTGRIMDENRNAQFKKDSFMEKWKPIIAMAIVALACIGCISMTIQGVNKMHKDNFALIQGEVLESRNMFRQALDTFTQTETEDGVTIKQKPTDTLRGGSD